MGAARACLEAAISRSTDREVFGKPIGANQLIQAKLADMFLEVEKGILLALHLGRLKEHGTLTPAQISVGKLNSVREALADRARGAGDPRGRRHHERVARSCGTRRTSSRCAPTRAPTRSTSSSSVAS